MASKRIQGITIEIDGETSKLTKSLEAVDKQLSKTQSNLRDINKLLKLDPGNTDLLTQKQKNLTTAIDATKTRLSELKKAQKDSVTPDEWDRLQREIIETEQKLESLQKEYKNFGSVAGQQIQVAGQKIASFGQGVEAVGKKIMPASLAVAGIGTAAIGAAKEVDKGYDTIITKTGATGKTLEGLQDQMDRVFSDMPTDAETAGIAIGEVNTRFGLLGDELGDVSAEFIRFAEINGTDVNNAIDSVDSVMKKFGVDTKDVGGVLGLMTAAGQRTGISMDTLEGALEKNGATMKEMGLGLEEGINLLANFEINGIDSSTALTALKKAQQNSTKAGKNMNVALKQGVTGIKNARTETKALELATELFGAKAAPEMTQAIREGRLSLDDLSASLGDYKDTVKNTYNETLDPWDKMKVAMNNLVLAGKELAEELFKVLGPIIEQIVEKVKAFTNWFKNLNDGQKETIVKIGLIVAAAGPLITIFGKAISGIGGLVTGFGKFVGFVPSVIKVLGSLVTGFAPFLVGGAVIAGGIAGIVLLVKNWDKIKDAAKKLGTSIKNSFNDLQKNMSNVWNSVKTTASNAWNAVSNSIAKTATSIKTSVQKSWNDLKLNTTNTWNGIKSATSTAWNNVKTSISNTANGIKTSAVTAWNSLKTSTEAAWNGIKTSAVNAANSLKTNAVNAWNTLKTNTSNAWDGIKTSVTNSVNNLKTNAQNTLNTLKTGVSGIWTSIKSTASTAWDGVKSAITGRLQSASSSVSSIMASMKRTISGAFSGLSRSIGNPFSNLVDWASRAIASIKSIFKGAKLSLPKIKMPHFNVTWNEYGPVKLPRIRVEWYKKAYDNPLMFTQPTIMQTPQGYKGFGDGSGPEIVMGLNKLRELVGTSASGTTINVYAQPGMNVKQLATEIQNRLAQVERQKQRAWA